MKLALTSLIVLLSAAVGVQAAIQAVNIDSGDVFTVTMDSGFHLGKVSEIAATYEIADLGFFDQVILRDPKTGTISRDLTVSAPQGTYLLVVKLFVNKKLSKTEEILLTVLPEGTRASMPGKVTTSAPPSTTKPLPTTAPPPGPRAQIIIPRVPDIEPGTTFVIPVTIRGQGVYTAEIAQLSYGTYEVPEYIEVHGERTFPVLLHVDENAKPGVYALQVAVGGDSATTRVRIIKYHKENYWWLLIPAGIILVVLGILLLFQLKRRQPYEPVRPQPPKTGEHSGDLITYY